MTVGHVVGRVRAMMGEVPDSSDNVSTDVDVISSPETSFSDADIVQRLNEAAHEITRRCKAQHVQSLISEKTGTSSVSGADVMRVLPHTVKRYDDSDTPHRSVRRSVEQNRRMMNRGITLSISEPVHVYEDGELEVFPDGAPKVTFMAVTSPTPHTTNDLTDELELDERFELALIAHVVSSLFSTKERPEVSKAFRQVFEDEIRPYLIRTRHTYDEDREVDVE